MDFLKKFEHLAAESRLRPEPPFAPDGVMARIDGMLPDPVAEEYSGRLLFTMAVATSAAAAAMVVVALAAWTDLHDPFLAIRTLGGVLERL